MKIDGNIQKDVADKITKTLDGVIKFRHSRHQHPDLTWQEEKTAAAVAMELKKIEGLEITEGVGRLGVTALIKGSQPGPTVALRADMDALPLVEESGLPYASCEQGKMHACGHDGHMANLLGSAHILASLRSQIKGNVKLIFQPAEEGGAGAREMINDGVLEGVDVIFGLHGWPELGCGKIYTRPGSVFAANAEITIGIEGTGCHAAMPHLGTDQILTAARVIESIQSLVSRFVSPSTALAVTIAQINGGTATNIIPSRVQMAGTMRALSQNVLKEVEKKMHSMLAGIAQSAGNKISLEVKYQYPEVFNHAEPTQFLHELGKEVLSEADSLTMPEPTMGAEDFSFYLQEIPGSYFLLGVDDGRTGGYPSLHHPKFDFNDRALPIGMKMFVHAALAWPDHS
jgi:amidohydrolase